MGGERTGVQAQVPTCAYVLMHVDKSGDRFHFDCSGRLTKDLQAMSAVAEQPREETLDGLS